MPSKLLDLKTFTTSSLLLLVVFAVCCFLGCQQKPKTSANSKITLTFWTLQLQDFKTEIERLEKGFEKLHPEVDVVWVDVPFSEGEKKVLTSILSGNPPDVINLNPDFSALLANRNALLDLNDWLSETDKARYVPVGLKACQLTQNNHTQQFGLPWYLTTAVTYYNKNLLHKAGFKKPPKTLAQLKLLAQRLKQKKLGTALILPISQGGRFLKWLYQQDITLANTENQFDFAQPKSVEQLTYWKTLLDQGLIPKATVNVTFQDVLEQYQSGQVAMMVAGSSVLGNIQKNAPKVYQQTQVATQFPKSQLGRVDFATMLLAVPKQSKHPKLAVALSQYITQNTYGLSQLAPILPSTQADLKRPYFTTITPKDVLSKTRVISAKQLLEAKEALQIHPQQKQLNAIMDYAVQSALLGKQSPTEALQLATQKANEL